MNSKRKLTLQHLPILLLGGVSVEKDGHVQLLGEPPSKEVCTADTVLHGHAAAHRNERTDVQGTQALVFALVFGHVDQASGHPGAGQGALHHRLRRADKGVDGAIRRGARVHVQQGDTSSGPDCRGDGLDYL